MTGCDACGAQAGVADSTCPVCGVPLEGGPHPRIPVRRYGTVPPPPAGYSVAPAEAVRGRRRPARWLAGLAALGAVAVAAAWPW